MSLYRGMAAVYDRVFPLRPQRVSFVAALCPRPGSAVLDIGCATGALALELARAGHRVTALDLDEEMVRIAADRARAAGLPVRTMVVDMTDARSALEPETFDLLTCLGNTLVHLADAAGIRGFLTDLGSLLAPGGAAVLQHLLYERHLRGEPPDFPVIENDAVRFSRRARYLRPEHRVEFLTELEVKLTGEIRRERTLLYPLTLLEFLEMLPACGLALESRHADFTGRPAGLAESSHIAVLRRAS